MIKVLQNRIMKRFYSFLLCATLAVTVGSAQGIKTCYNVYGYWSSWFESNLSAYGNYHTISLYDPRFHPSIYVCKFEILNWKTPDKKEIKEHWKNKTWYEYIGTFEYYISDALPSAKAAFLKQGMVAPPEYGVDKKPRVKKRVTATIKIAPYKKHPEVYNVFFDGLGVGFSLDGITFSYW